MTAKLVGVREKKLDLLGKEYEIVCEITGFLEVIIMGEEIHFQFVKQPRRDDLQKRIDTLLLQTSQKYLPAKLEHWAGVMQIPIHKIVLKNQKTRWGSCSSSGTISLNWRMIHLPTELSDYVLIHELAHRIHMNHGPQFWALVGKYCADYKFRRTSLKKIQIQPRVELQ